MIAELLAAVSLRKKKCIGSLVLEVRQTCFHVRGFSKATLCTFLQKTINMLAGTGPANNNIFPGMFMP